MTARPQPSRDQERKVIYELAILGTASNQERQALTRSIQAILQDFGLELHTDVMLRDGQSIANREPKAPIAAVYFGGDPHLDLSAIQDLKAASAPIIPLTAPGMSFTATIPEPLHAANGLTLQPADTDLEVVAAALLECVGLLREQRRVFVSYRRTESRAAAVQLHDVLCARGFDVFLDTHDIRPGAPFQDMLWHRLVDSDVMVMLDTPTYFDRRWTSEEFFRASYKKIAMLRVIWPGHTPTRQTDLSETLYLDTTDLEGRDGPFSPEIAETIALRVERLRSRGIATRHLDITGKFRNDLEKIGATIEAIGAHRAVTVSLFNGRRIWAYPVVGIPTAESFYNAFEKAKGVGSSDQPVVLYDHVGIGKSWMGHLLWLGANIRDVRAIPVAEAGWILAGWEN